MPATFTLHMSRHVSKALLPDLKALIAPEAMQFFSNELGEEWHYTLLCQQSDESCSLAVSAIMVWHQLKRITTLSYSNASCHKELTKCTAGELFSLLKMPGAALYLS
ncbi:hypothetical protein Q3V30_06275 [Erwinia pyri]|uniref:Uncharacterized protein n=1 Tax=Erwinia pyri TaxID=3062598 RepID=A0AA50DPZ8_9GAMM|nr:hypothetical protein [Erwinia sp. DE2]WLS80085.1 hypothetical protein Q3V30_06275 [Erwinia sp. DE2]